MLVPKFSVRTLIVITTIFAGLSWVARSAWHGSDWAIGIGAAAISVVIVAGIHATVFLAAFALATASSSFFGRLLGRKDSTTPFAGNRLPPQHVVPIDPD